MLNITKVELELISDADIYLFFEKGIRGRVFYTFNRYIQANNKYLTTIRNKNQNIIYVDASNLYGYAMSNFSPTGEFKWIDSKDFDSTKCNKNSSKVCVLQVDFKYPKELC